MKQSRDPDRQDNGMQVEIEKQTHAYMLRCDIMYQEEKNSLFNGAWTVGYL